MRTRRSHRNQERLWRYLGGEAPCPPPSRPAAILQARVIAEDENGGRIFRGVYPAGIVYADRTRERHGDYPRLAFLPFQSLELEIEPDCPDALRAEIIADAAILQARRGEEFVTSACGQTVRLGT